MDLEAIAKEATDTNFTPTVHRSSYPTISPTRPEQSQIGKTVLITGGGTGIGKAIARNFTLAHAAKVIIVARQGDRLKTAAAELEMNAVEAHSPTKFIARSCDVTKPSEVTALWSDLASQAIHVDVVVLNAAKFTEPQALFDLGIEEVWSQFEANVKGPLHFAEQFYKQTGDSQKFLVNVTTASIHTLQNPVVAARPAYSLTKASGTYAAQVIASSVTPEQMQVISFHPGLVHGLGWVQMGISKDTLPFDDDDMPGAFAVWAASKEARFLHGRYAWASWDVNEISKGEIRKCIDENPDFLTMGIIGLKGTHRA